jgi:hypothetical protein
MQSSGARVPVGWAQLIYAGRFSQCPFGREDGDFAAGAAPSS